MSFGGFGSNFGLNSMQISQSQFGGGRQSNNNSNNLNNNNKNGRSMLSTKKIECSLHQGQKVTAICLKEECSSAQRLACFQCMTSSHFEDSKHFVSLKEVKQISQKQDVYEIYNYPPQLFGEEEIDWIKNYNQKLDQSEGEIKNFFENLKQDVNRQLEASQEILIQNLEKKRTVVDQYVSAFKEQVNKVFSLDGFKTCLNEVFSGNMNFEQFNKEVEIFIKDEKKNKLKESVQKDVQKITSLFHLGYIKPSLEESFAQKEDIINQIVDLQSKLCSPIQIELKSGRPDNIDQSTGSLYIFNKNEKNQENKENEKNQENEQIQENQEEVKFETEEGFFLEQQGGQYRLKILLKDLSENEGEQDVTVGIYAKGEEGKKEESGTFIRFGKELQVGGKGEVEAKKWAKVVKDFRNVEKGLVLDFVVDVRNNQFDVYEVGNGMRLFKNNDVLLKEDKKEWALYIQGNSSNEY
ncbi:hypothetical protein PPERSA_03455 [Pseudocohnilembus persalinus]|uniref:Uncharacterized protein n=1 Tax=Pseudocohnilembus persalinus TaxID=266149 RepID=A0A0V0QBN6_PSEPJ|nr:hypothetical protein PPERSA_03455 [Pseudocohnilembus persalinus]|eukprot:KRW99654.1 hypothetical protein PPERSA_03455 [Pseudocohnilembus persalinus]